MTRRPPALSKVPRDLAARRVRVPVREMSARHLHIPRLSAWTWARFAFETTQPGGRRASAFSSPCALLGHFKKDTIITRDEIAGLMEGLLEVETPPTGTTRLTGWLDAHAATLGRRYTSELARRQDRTTAYRHNG